MEFGPIGGGLDSWQLSGTVSGDVPGRSADGVAAPKGASVMDFEVTAETGNPEDPVRVFAARLRALQVRSGGPSVRDLVRLTDRAGTPYSRGTIQDKLAGRSAAPWEFVEAFVRACALHTGGSDEPDLRPWREWHGQMAREVAAARAGRRRTVRTDVCPYRGLESFTAEHAQWFHGRGAAVQDVLTGLAAYRKGLVLLGPSGAGKSSLVQAGVLPALADGQLPGSDRWLTVLARPGKDLPSELVRAGLPEASEKGIAAAVAARLAEEPSPDRLVLVLDQFEEMLTPGVDDEQAAAQLSALDDLAEAVGAAGLSLVLVLRDDFYPRLAALAPDLLNGLLPGLLNVPATLNTDDLREIIVRPAEAVGLDFEAGLPERITADMLAADASDELARHAPITALPLLELALRQLWHRRQDTTLTHEAYQRVGGIAGALTTWCDTAIERLPAEHHTVAQQILTALVRPADDARHIPAVRQQLPVTTLRELAGDGCDEVLAMLIDQRIVTTRTMRQAGDQPGVPVAELVHEALIRDWAALRDWVGQDHRFQDWLRRAGEREARWAPHRDPGDLLSGSELAEGNDWSTRRGLPEQVAKFLKASRRRQVTGVRRARAVQAVLATLLMAALIATGLAFVERRDAVGAQRIALSRQLAAQSTAVQSDDPDLAALLAVQAYRVSPTGEAKGTVFTAAASPLRRRLNTVVEDEPTVSFSPDGTLLAAGSGRGPVRLWEIPDGHQHATLTGHTGTVNFVAFSPDGRLLASAGADHTLRLWDMTGRRAPLVLEGHGKPVTKAVFSPDGFTLASASEDNTIRLWDVRTGNSRAPMRVIFSEYYSLAFSPDSRTIAAGAQDGTLSVWETSTGSLHKNPKTHSDIVNWVAFSPDGRTAATAGEDRTVQIWDTRTWSRPRRLSGHTAAVYVLAFSPDGRTLVTGGDDRTARLWDTRRWQPRHTLSGHLDGVNELAFNRDGTMLATGGADGGVRLWDMSSGEPRGTLPGGSVNRMAFNRDGDLLATGGNDGARLWDLTAIQPRFTKPGNKGRLSSVAFSPDGRSMVTGGTDGVVRFFDPLSGDETHSFSNEGEESRSAYSRDGRLLATAGKQTRLWDLATRSDPKALSFEANCLAFSPDGHTLATADSNGVIQLWDIPSGRRGPKIKGHAGVVNSVAFSPDGSTLATAGEDGYASLWNPADGRRLAKFEHAQLVLAVAFSPDGRTLVTTGWE
ncbi:WD40 repeat domain-containing protein, partial [Actinoplanes sp. NPDC051633]|uniref:WD40 repeat domain-containing protein n=1 Tax=Actinoplanes sp. NPDC051633 TaxID=3155670 RepID=UPI0034306EA8